MQREAFSAHTIHLTFTFFYLDLYLLYQGWEDPHLAIDGIEDAKNAGRLLKRHGFEFDVVYTSWLTRAIQTAWYVMDELDMLWLPMVSTSIS